MSENKFTQYIFENDFFDVKVSQEPPNTEKPEAGLSNEYVEVTEEEPQQETLEQAYQRGLQEGVIQGQEQASISAESQLSQHLGPLIERLEVLQQTRQEYAQHIERHAILAIQEILKKVVGDAASKYPETIFQTTLHNALAHVQKHTGLKLIINPSTKQYVDKIAKGIIERYNIDVLESSDVTEGDCLIEWDMGGIEASFKQSLAEIDTLLTGVASSPPLPTIDEIDETEKAKIEPKDDKPAKKPSSTKTKKKAATEEEAPPIANEPQGDQEN